MKFRDLLVVLISLNRKCILAAPNSAPECNNRFANELPGSFPGVVAHGIHSITIPDIHFYFPTDKTDIQMPVVNPDLLSDAPILSKPVDFKHSFTSPALRVIDQALTHMNSKHYDLSLYNDLEKIVHAAHMQDVWLEAGKAYNKMQESNNIDDGLCACVKDVENNGIVSMLRLIALKLREPALMYGEHSEVKVATDEQTPYLLPRTSGGYGIVAHASQDNEKHFDRQDPLPRTSGWSGNLYRYSFKQHKLEPNHQERNNGLDELVKSEIMDQRNDEADKPLPHLREVKDWNYWKADMLTMEPHKEDYSNQLALFMHCALK